MFCMNCGTQNDEGSAFCMKCGAKLEAGAQATPKAPKAKPTARKAAPAQPQPVAAAAPVAQPQVAPVTAPAQEGPLSAAWHDIKSTPHWFRKILFMGLCNLIPFMSFGTIGFAQQWGVDVAKGKRETMPNKIFSNKSFLSGLIEYLTWLMHGFVYGVAALIVSTIFIAIPVINILIGVGVFVFVWFWNSYVALAVVRSSITVDLGDAFRVREIFPVMKRKFGSAFCVFFIPSILCGLICIGIVIVLALIFFLIVFGIAGTTFASFNSHSSSSNPLNNFNAIWSTILSSAGIALVFIVVGVLLISCVVFFMSVLEKLLRYRAIGHWIALYAPEWGQLKVSHIQDKQ